MLDLSKERVLLTGASGFLGRHVSRRLARIGTTVLAPSRDKFDLDGDLWGLNIREEKPSIVIHLAAYCGGIGLNADEPAAMFSNNMRMGMNAVRLAVESHCRYHFLKHLILVGSVCSYPRDCPVPFREENLWSGRCDESNRPYGEAKRALFTYAEACRKQYGLPVSMLIPANLFGPGDHFEPERSHVIPALIRKFVEAMEQRKPSVELWGTGDATRDFLYIEDAADAIVRAAASEPHDGPVNLGTGHECRIGDLALMISKAVGYDGIITYDTSKPDGQPRRVLECSKAKAWLGWEAITPLETGLQKTIDWYLANRI